MQPTALASHLEPGTRPRLAFPRTKYAHSNEAKDIVYLIDGDVAFREELLEHLRALGIDAIGFKSTHDYQKHTRFDRAACLVVDFHAPDACGLALLREVKNQAGPPVIFISGSPDIPNTVSAMRAGAMEFFEKPVDFAGLQAAIRLAFVQDRKARQREQEISKLKARFSLLTPREREVLPLVVGGLPNKRAAAVLGISEVTLQIHRSQVMRKMAAESVTDLVRMAVKLRIPYRGEDQLAQAASVKDQQRAKQCWAPRLVTS